MTSRRAQAVALALIALGLGVFLVTRSSPQARERPAALATATALRTSVASGAAEAARVAPLEPLPLPSSAAAELGRPWESTLTPQAAAALEAAVKRFALAGLPAVDGCLGPAPGPRGARLVLVDFHREVSAGDGVRLVADGLKLAGHGPTQAGAEHRVDVERCLGTLAGRDFVVPPDVKGVPDHLSRVVSLPLPDPTRVEPKEEGR